MDIAGFLGEIRMFTGDYAPVDWALCDGRKLPIQGNEALFSLLGAQYGGDGIRDFALPDLRGRLPVGQGQGGGLSPRTLGQQMGSETVSLTESMLPPHTHAMQTGSSAMKPFPEGNLPGLTEFKLYATSRSVPATMARGAVSPTGGGQAHSNMMPSQCINYIINVQGAYPQFPR